MTLYTVKNDLISVTVSDLGAELYSIKKDGTEYLWQGDEKYWSGRALNIFPYVARLWGGKYTLDGEEYEMNIHGIAPYAVFEAEVRSDTELVFTLASNGETKKQYPREFVFRVIYNIEENKLNITYSVENRDERTMYFGIGGHPGFNVPLSDGLSFEDYRLEFDEKTAPRRVVFTPDCFVTEERTPIELCDGRMLPLHHEMFDCDAIVMEGMPSAVVLRSIKDQRCVRVTYPDMKYLGIWHRPKTDAPYICIEPWRSLPSCDGAITALEDQEDLVALPAGGVYENRWTVEVV